MNKEIQHWYAHIDLDAFFASVEQLDHPEFKGKPVTFSIAAETINNDEFTYYVILHPSIILKFLLYTLYNINKYYGNK